MSEPFYTGPDGLVEIHNGDSAKILRDFPENHFDAIVTDPPYGLRFMGKRWDYDLPPETIWRQCFRVLKPGGHLLSFGGTRTYHRLAVAIEEAGFEIRDMIAWVYGSGFPKSRDISKAIDAEAGAEREVVGPNPYNSLRGISTGGHTIAGAQEDCNITAPATPAARQWDGWGSALKPAHEPVTVARKPMPGTIAANVLEHGTGALNIDASRIGDFVPTQPSALTWGDNYGDRKEMSVPTPSAPGRFPANLIHDGSDEVVRLFPETTSKGHTPRDRGAGGIGCNGHSGQVGIDERHHDTGSAARFFYCAKASQRDRDEGVGDSNRHPTVKPINLMRWLCRLVTPPGGLILDPFLGSGSTGKAAIMEGFRFVGVELEEAYCRLARERIRKALEQGTLAL